MAKTLSTMVPLGTKAPPFCLLDVCSQEKKTFEQISLGKKATTIMFLCNHCPFVRHLHPAIIDVANTYIQKGIAFAAISSNDVRDYPEDDPKNMALVAKKWHYPFPYLYDETQQTAKQYGASCTPDFFLFDQHDRLVYRGRFDESRPGNSIAPTGFDLTLALNTLLSKQPISQKQFPSIGCNIKWKEIESSSI